MNHLTQNLLYNKERIAYGSCWALCWKREKESSCLGPEWLSVLSVPAVTDRVAALALRLTAQLRSSRSHHIAPTRKRSQLRRTDSAECAGLSLPLESQNIASQGPSVFSNAKMIPKEHLKSKDNDTERMIMKGENDITIILAVFVCGCQSYKQI